MALFDPHDCGLITTSCHDGTGIRNAREWIGETIPKQPNFLGQGIIAMCPEV